MRLQGLPLRAWRGPASRPPLGLTFSCPCNSGQEGQVIWWSSVERAGDAPAGRGYDDQCLPVQSSQPGDFVVLVGVHAGEDIVEYTVGVD